MTTSALESATLLCMHPFGETSKDPLEFSLLFVGGMELPGQATQLHPNRSSLLPDPTTEAELMSVELKWPPEMLDRLGKLFTAYHIDKTSPLWNCHSFGAMVTGQLDDLPPPDMNMPRDIDIKERGRIGDLTNTVLYGAFEQDDAIPWHSFVGSQNPDKVVQVRSVCGQMCVASSEIASLHNPNGIFSYVHRTSIAA